MTTHATIAVRRADGTYDAVYLHYDGYPGYVGELLQTHHQSPALAESLIAGGEIRLLHQEDGAPEYFEDGLRLQKVQSHEELVELAKQTWSQYLYVFDREIWSCMGLSSSPSSPLAPRHRDR